MMPPQILSLKKTERIDDLEAHIEDLVRQKDVLQRIEQYTSNKLDFGDLLETYKLLVEEIERLQQQLREGKREHSEISGGRGFVEEEEEEVFSFSCRFDLQNRERFAVLVKERAEEVERLKWGRKK